MISCQDAITALPLNKVAVLREVVDKAKEMTTQRCEEFPKYRLYNHAAEQLEFIEKFLLANILPSTKEVGQIDIGIMAVKELEEEDPEYALLLMKVHRRFEDLIESTSE
jgi:hypothetical protein